MNFLPSLCGGVDATVDRDPGVRDEQIDPSEAVDRGGHETLDVLLAADVGGHGEGADRCSLPLAGLLTEVRQHDMRAFARKPSAQRKADAAGAAGHDAHLVFDVHG
jgi:hypothetical protein